MECAQLLTEEILSDEVDEAEDDMEGLTEEILFIRRVRGRYRSIYF
ncbi:hypothetical protein Hanom_Chr08g00697011 [Helianthus anomalus]